MTSVLVVRPSSLGDVVHALPIVADMRAARPGIAVDWVAEEAFAPLVELHPDIRTVVPLALRRWRHVLHQRSTWREIRAFRARLRADDYEAVFDLQEQTKGAVIARMARGARHGFDRRNIREPLSTLLHDVHHNVPRAMHFESRCRALAGAAFGYSPQGAPRYGLLPAALPAEIAPTGRYVVLVHAASRADKLWPERDWHAVLTCCGRAGYSVVLPWGNAEERARSVRLASGHPTAWVLTRQPLAIVAALLAHAHLVIGVDTGLVHLAAALGRPTLALFTETDPKLAGVAIAGAHARDLGGCGRVPALDEAIAALAPLLQQVASA